MMILLLTIFFLCFTFLAWYRFSLGLGIFFFLLPAYLLRFMIGPLPVTVLEVMLLILLVIGVWQRWDDLNFERLKKHTWFMVASGLFLVTGAIGVVAGVEVRSALGEWKAFYVEPVLLGLFLLLAMTKKDKQYIFRGLALSALVTSTLAFVQHGTGWMVPWDFWENRGTFRVTGWYGFPNGIGLYLASLWFVSLSVLKRERDFWRWVGGFAVVLSPFAIWFAKSTGAIMGIMAGAWVMLVLAKKTRLPVIVLTLVGVLGFLALPMENSVKQELLLQDRSGQIRLTMWGEAYEMLSDRPLFGAGLASYEERVEPYHRLVNGEGVEIFHHPHNMFLTIWSNLGLLGLLAYTVILVYLITYGVRKREYTLLAVLMTFVVMGLVDSPYIKNDMALLFWTIVAMLLWRNARVVE